MDFTRVFEERPLPPELRSIDKSVIDTWRESCAQTPIWLNKCSIDRHNETTNRIVAKTTPTNVRIANRNTSQNNASFHIFSVSDTRHKHETFPKTCVEHVGSG
jgi:hypothetical protein